LLKKKIRNDRCIVCVMHDLNLVYQYSDYVILMKDGKIYAHGMPDEVLNEVTIKAVYGILVEYIKNKGFLIRGGQHEKNDNFGIG